MSYITNVEELVETLRHRLPDYLEKVLGADEAGRTKGKFRCFAHDDTSPSMSYNPKDGFTTVRCWSGCGSFDIFSACAQIEGMPATGPEWITSTLPHLAEKLGVKVQTGEPTVADRQKAMLYKLATDISNILETSEANKDYIENRKWSDEFLTIGSVDEDELYGKLADLGWSANDINQTMMVRTRSTSFFGEDKVTFAIKDYRGRASAFVSRQLGEGKRPKYINSPESPIYEKRKLLFGLDVALSTAKKDGLYVVEGPGDLAAMHKLGITNVAAICGTAFTADHLALLKMLGIRNVYFCLDWDDAGLLATHRIFKEELRFAPGVNCFVIEQPQIEGHDAPKDVGELCTTDYGDTTIDGKYFQALPKAPAFEWTLKFVSDNDSPESICADMIPLIATENSAVRRELLTMTLSEFSGISYQSISQDIASIRDSKEQERKERIEGAIQRYNLAASKDPENVLAHMGQHESDLERIEQSYKRNVIGVNYQLHRYDAIQEQKGSAADDANKAEFQFVHHSYMGDALRGGMNSTSGVLVFVGGRANSGKTATVLSLGIDVALHDEDAVVCIHSTDDSYTQIEPRLLSNIAAMMRQPDEPKLTIGMAANPKYNILTDAQWECYHKAVSILRQLIQEERLVVIDSEDGANLTVLERNLRHIRKQAPDKKMMVILDNQYNLHDFPEKDQTSRMRDIATMLKTFTGKYRCAIWSTAEYRKNMPGDESKMKLPVNDDLADARAMIYRPNLIIHVYNDLHDRGEHAEVFWTDRDEPGVRKPRLMLIFSKNKITSFKSPEKRLILELDPETVSMRQRDENKAKNEAADFMAAKQDGRVQLDGDRVVYTDADY